MRYTNQRIRNYKNLDEQRQDNEKSQRRTSSMVKFRIAILVIVGIIALVENLPPVFSDSFIGTFPVIVMILAFAFPIPVIAGVIFALSAKRKRKQEDIYSDETPRSYSQYERSVKSEEPYAANKERNHVKSESFTGYSDKIVDPWDIKDAKPPWEL